MNRADESCEVAFALPTMPVTAPQVLLAVAVVLATVILRASVKPGGAPLLILLCGAGYALSGVAIRALAIPLAPAAPKSPSALKIGLIGAAKIAPWGLLYPARASANVTVVAVGARDPVRAAALAARWEIPRHGDYAAVLADPEVEAVYIALVNGQHFAWADAALRAGKHVLLEKPLTNNADEARALAELARRQRRVLVEGYHWRHHALVARVKALVAEDGELGPVRSLEVGAGMISGDGLRSLLGLGAGASGRSAKMDVALGGGNFMGQGCYAVSVARELLGEPERVVRAAMVEDSPGSRADVAAEAELAFAGGATATLRSSATTPFGFHLRARCERGTLDVTNYLFPFLYHAIGVRPDGGRQRYEKAHSAPAGTTTFDLQLAAFAAAVRDGAAPPGHGADDAVRNMAVIDEIYEAAGLGKRPSAPALAVAQARAEWSWWPF